MGSCFDTSNARPETEGQADGRDVVEMGPMGSCSDS